MTKKIVVCDCKGTPGSDNSILYLKRNIVNCNHLYATTTYSDANRL